MFMMCRLPPFCLTPASPLGFVVAMRAKLTNTSGTPHSEWMIVSRWGLDGEYISIGWTYVSVGPGDAPIYLTPSRTALALQQQPSGVWNPTTFRLVPSLPEQLTVAGGFVPAEGYVQLYGSGQTLRMRSKGHGTEADSTSAWTIKATRAAWIGEFIEQKPETDY
jgi:hypothetical protein